MKGCTPYKLWVTSLPCVALFLLLCVASSTQARSHGNESDLYNPEQIHISYGEGSSMIITWSTFRPDLDSLVVYTDGMVNKTAKGRAKRFVNPDLYFHTQYIHVVIVTGLKPGAKYVYRCGSPDGWSKLLSFRAKPSGEDWSPSLLVFGDMGAENAQSLKRMIAETQKGMYDAVLHIGDFAYDMRLNHGEVGDQFMRNIQPIAAHIPYMTCPGNHENYANFSNYRNRFHMPGDINTDNMFYSFNLGPAHIISISTEFYFYVQYGLMQIERQYRWLEQDLRVATEPGNRAKRPWIIVMGHRPMYCTNSDKDDCTYHESIIRRGIPLIHTYGLESLLYKYGVDLELWAHEHSYERLLPIYDYQILNTSAENPYDRPEAPVHITTGSAGCKEKHDPFTPNATAWSAFRSTDYGYSRIRIYNNTHLYMEQVSDDQSGKVIDNMWLIKDRHGPYRRIKEPRPMSKEEKEWEKEISRKSLFQWYMDKK
ncbi:acid phosphatase type 7-like isoform X1 [Argonauta hians]